ncbi:hypothetical protein Asi02nite_78130 [Asanoa siamensis]|uniref:Uncharacterized protein n=1 Tax=Asanoa siamensis TaxID=926357 RepID=A0ABQ4D466_9ACTN|nr:hypothetical protein Asi02nite_78130 [Asanoa siamensis]
MALTLDAAVDLTRTGDVWLFRGSSVPDRAIRLATNSPVNHVGMSVVIEDMPALMWHAELGRSLRDIGRVRSSAACNCTTCATRCCCGPGATASAPGCASSRRR